MTPEQMESMAKAVVKVLTLAEKCGLANQNVNLDEQDPIRVYVGLLAEHGVRAEHVESASSLILARTFFPRPGEFLDCCLEAKLVMDVARKRAYLNALTEGKTQDGFVILASPDRFDENGVYISQPKPLPGPASEEVRLRMKALIGKLTTEATESAPMAKVGEIIPLTPDEIVECEAKREMLQRQANDLQKGSDPACE